MEKEENQDQKNSTAETLDKSTKAEQLSEDTHEENINLEDEKLSPEENKNVEEEEKLSPEEKIKGLEDKLARTFDEMENQRRRFEKEKDDAFDYGGYAFAKEALNLIDNLARSKLIL